MDYFNVHEMEKEEQQKELIYLAQKLKRRKKFIYTSIICVFILTALAFAWFSGRKNATAGAAEQIDQLTEEINTLKSQIEQSENAPALVNPVAPEIVLEKKYNEIKSIGELATIEYLFTDAGKFSDSKQYKDWNIPFTEKSFILKWSGVIKAGVNLDAITIDVEESSKTITLTIPPATILSYETDSNSAEVLDETNNLFNPVTINDKLVFDQKTQDAITARAIESGLLEKATKNAQDVLLRLFTFDPAIGENYTIEFVITDK